MRIGIALAMVLAACGDDGTSMPMVDAAPVNPPTKFVYLNFEGVTLQQGDPNPSTNTWPASTQTFAPFHASHPNRAEIIDGIVAQTRELLAPYDIGVEKDRPTDKYMMIVFSGLAEDNGSTAGNGGEAAIVCGLSAFSPAISTQYQLPDDAMATPEQISNVHSFMTIAELGLAHGIVQVTTPGNCMCWNAAECFTFDYYMQRCTIQGTAMIDPTPQCPHTGTTIDMGAEFLAKLKPHP